MIKITKTELKDKITYYVQTLGLKNDEIATRLNEDYNADDKEKLTGLNVAALKKQLGIKGIKPKKKSLFEFVEEPAVREGWDEAFKAASLVGESDEEDIPMEYFENSKY